MRLVEELPATTTGRRGVYDEARAFAKANPGQWVEVDLAPGLVKPPYGRFRGFEAVMRAGLFFVRWPLTGEPEVSPPARPSSPGEGSRAS